MKPCVEDVFFSFYFNQKISDSFNKNTLNMDASPAEHPLQVEWLNTIKALSCQFPSHAACVCRSKWESVLICFRVTSTLHFKRCQHFHVNRYTPKD